jgi:hypothetical protein
MINLRHVVVVSFCIAAVPAVAGVEGTDSTFYGTGAGVVDSADGNSNTFIGANAGHVNTTGFYNAFLGFLAGTANITGYGNTSLGATAGAANTTGNYNVAVGYQAGHGNQIGNRNVFIGYGAGYIEGQSDRLYIDNCASAGFCTSPLIYGEFDTNRLRLNGMTEVHYNGQPKSQLNFSLSSSDTGGYVTSVADNNFFTSSGARYDGTLSAPNQWVQRSPDGNSVIAGSGNAGYRIFTSSGKTVGNGFAPTVRLHVNYAGEFGINQAPVAGHEIHTSSGAYLAAGTWTNASSREFKDNIVRLSADEASQALAALDPVKFNYKDDALQQHVGFIAEDVPDLVAMKDRKGLSPMDIVAVLTKVVQEQRQQLAEQNRQLQVVRESTEERLQELTLEVTRLRERPAR